MTARPTLRTRVRELAEDGVIVALCLVGWGLGLCALLFITIAAVWPAVVLAKELAR